MARSPSPSFAQTGAEFTLSDNDSRSPSFSGDDASDASDVFELLPPGQPPAGYTPAEDAAVRRKFDRRLVLFVALLFLLSFLDRSSTSSPSSLGLG